MLGEFFGPGVQGKTLHDVVLMLMAWAMMMNQIYNDWFAELFSARTLATLAEMPALAGVSLAALGLLVIIFRRRSSYQEALEFGAEESLFPAVPFSGVRPLTGTLSLSASAEHATESRSRPDAESQRTFSPLQLVDKEFRKDPHAYLRKLLASESLALQELVSRSNSLQLLCDTYTNQQSPQCIELLRCAQHILKSAAQRCATVELLLDDAEADSLRAARELLSAPLEVAALSSRIAKMHFESAEDWLEATRALLDDAERQLRVAAVG